MLSKIIRRAGRHTRRHTHVTISCYYIKTYAINRSRFESLSAHRTGPTACRARVRLVRPSLLFERKPCDISSHCLHPQRHRVFGRAGRVYPPKSSPAGPNSRGRVSTCFAFHTKVDQGTPSAG
jgi:hypothetical protein